MVLLSKIFFIFLLISYVKRVLWVCLLGIFLSEKFVKWDLCVYVYFNLVVNFCSEDDVIFLLYLNK